LRISFLCPHVRIAGGVRAILTYADRLARRGHTVDVVVPAKGGLRARWRNARGVGPTWIPRFAARIRWVGEWRASDLTGSDVAVATAWQSADTVAAASVPAKVYLVQHYESLYHGQPETVEATYRLPLRTIVISTWLRDIMREKFERDAEVLVTPVDRELFHPVAAPATTVRPRVLMLHHSYAWKGVGDGLDAVARVKRRVPVHLVGFGVKPPTGRMVYDEFHADAPQAKLAQLYSSADVYLCPSWDEGLGMPSMEAMACGAALVTYDNGGSRDYARDGETALVAKRRDVAHLAAKLERIVRDEALRAKIAERGRQFVTTAFDWDRAVERMETLFVEATHVAGRS
jgi:glycosyltransferase involved in cell wall biosynthesis